MSVLNPQCSLEISVKFESRAIICKTDPNRRGNTRGKNKMHPGRDCARAERSPTGEAARDANCRRWREKVQICAPSLLKCKLPSIPAPHGLLRRSRTRTNGGGRGPGAAGLQGPCRAADAVADTARRGGREAQIRRPPRPGLRAPSRPGRRVPPVARPRSCPAPPPARAELGAGGGSGEGAELRAGGGSGEGPP